MSDIHEYNHICSKLRQEAVKWEDTNKRVYYAIDWYVADPITRAKQYINRMTDYSCDMCYGELKQAFNSLRLLGMMDMIPSDLYGEVHKFISDEMAECIDQKYRLMNPS